MAKQSAYLQRRDAQLDAVFWAGAAMAAQFAVDTLQMTMHQKEGWGYDRIMRVTHEWMETPAGIQTCFKLQGPGGGRPTGAHGSGAGGDYQRKGRADPVSGSVSKREKDQIREVRHG